VRLTGTTPGVTITGSVFRHCGDEAVRSDDSDALQLLGNTIENSDGVQLIGDDVRAERNAFVRSGGTCLEIDGGAALVTGNRFALCDDGIDVAGNGASLTRNSLASTDGTGIATDGDNPVIEGNSVSGAGDGVSARCIVTCEGGRITRNRLGAIRGTGIDVETADAGLVVSGNQVSQSRGVGLFFDSLGVRAERNRVTGAGSTCLRVTGDDNTILSNGLADCAGDAIRVTGDDNLIEGNRGAGIGGDGIDVEDGSGNDLVENQASSAADNGIEVSTAADGTTVSGNRSSGFRADYCDSGSATGGSDVADDTSGCGDID
jgi:parallel beta-helix repeat protein